MKIINVEVVETLRKSVSIEVPEDIEQEEQLDYAINTVGVDYANELIVLDYNDFVETKFLIETDGSVFEHIY